MKYENYTFGELNAAIIPRKNLVKFTNYESFKDRFISKSIKNYHGSFITIIYIQNRFLAKHRTSTTGYLIYI